MKRLFSLGLLAVAAVVFSACDTKTDDSYLSLPESVIISCDGGEAVVAVKASGDWNVSCDAGWLEFSPVQGTGNGEVSVSAGPNVTMEMLTANLVFVSGDMYDSCAVILEAAGNVRLDADGRSNCYIVPGRETEYAFDCRFRGNSESESVGEIDDVCVVWQTFPGLVSGLELDKETGVVTFRSGSSDGNVLVAVKDAQGKILWSWHLWLAGFDPDETSFQSPDNNGHSWTFMDRNLGALTAERGDIGALGLIYQWGRKDPFPGVGTFVGEEAPVYDGDGNEIASVPSRAGSFGTVALSIENPDIFYKISYDTQDWTDVSDDNYWGGVDMRKSVWDPCPPGWMVPLCSEDGTAPYGFMDNDNTLWDDENGGRYFDEWWLPAAGTRVYESGELSYIAVGPYGGMWLGTAGKASEDLETYPQRYGQYLFIIDGRMFKVMKDMRSQGMSVRCVKEK